MGTKQFLFLAFCLAFTGITTGQGISIEPVKMKPLVAAYTGEKGVVVVNFWSTWCKPCVEELPHFLRITDSLKQEGVSLWLVSQDTRDVYQSGKLMTFLQSKGWNARHFWLNETDADYYCPLVNPVWSGVIPATLIVNSAAHYTAFFEEGLTAIQLLAEIKKAQVAGH